MIVFLYNRWFTTIFYEHGFIDVLIKIAIDHGVPIIDAYNMATINVARYYNIEYLHGNIATGRVANINFLMDADESSTCFGSCKRTMGKAGRSCSGRRIHNLIGVSLILHQSHLDWELHVWMILSFPCHLVSRW